MLVRLLPILLLVILAGAWFADVQGDSPYVVRNLLPPLIVVALAALLLKRNGGVWKGADRRLPLGIVGFAIPALGLSAYLHYAYAVNLNGLFSGAERPLEVFRFLPYYTVVAGVIGFAIGWIVGRNV